MSTPWEIADQASRMLREVHQARADIADLLNELARQHDQQAGTALWCSLSEHAFSSRDLYRQFLEWKSGMGPEPGHEPPTMGM